METIYIPSMVDEKSKYITEIYPQSLQQPKAPHHRKSCHFPSSEPFPIDALPRPFTRSATWPRMKMTQSLESITEDPQEQ
ncbi:hypothetical protein K493DRAFT_311772 [Basidiobolus meristosporus CBS 931.73]|uniref:Uncharacterized protein n=1 Tax=Basidiobolus meristosporus CBS 931.73 TaxID=1314790 RepID=A0A1Y1YZ98_9FUNG|nr:hypothetical protein K493DRAFT_311772 [Basidiobolus meristosporus CBS 931.73]|eukprot:ORY03266.1 hypothetical protein K493DRAFT_311772 [Basidiobolus meristosporus CBS 931.73]